MTEETADRYLVHYADKLKGEDLPVLRAALMIEFVLFGKLIDRNADGIALLSFVALLLLIYNPAMLMEVGFQLSFLVTFALMYICPPLLGRIENKIAEFSAGICRDAGYQTMAGQIEIFGKLTILVMGLPVLLALLQTIQEFLS